MKRREFIKLGLQSAVLLSCAVKAPPVWAAASGQPLKSFAAFADTLIPEDESPSASALGLDRELIRHAEGVENYTRLLLLGCWWLDEQAATFMQSDFDALTSERREVVVTTAEVSPPGSIPRMFFERVRQDLFGFYYAHPASWKSLGLEAPPQPAGNPDYMKHPQGRVRG